MLDLKLFENARWKDLYQFFLAGEQPLVWRLMVINTIVLVVFINVARVVLIILVSSEWSHGIGFQLSHEYVGSLLTVFGMAVALLVYIVLLARDRSPVSTA